EEGGDGLARYNIDGGIPLHGTVEAAASKNAVLPIMAATLLTDDASVLHNVPQITDVVVKGHLYRQLGPEVEGRGGNTVRMRVRTARRSSSTPPVSPTSWTCAPFWSRWARASRASAATSSESRAWRRCAARNTISSRTTSTWAPSPSRRP